MVGITIDDTSLQYPIGCRIKVGSNCGTVKYVGEITGHPGTWLGIEWDDPKRGKHDGCVDGRRYFCTQHPTAGSFVRPEKLNPFESLEDAVRSRYLGYSANSLDSTLITEAQQSLQASFFEVVGMDKIARKQSKFEQLVEVSVEGCDVNSPGYLKDFTSLTTLNLSHTLIWNWETLADIAKQIPTLINLNLSGNRFITPTDGQVMELEASFQNLQHINLRSCGYKDWAEIMQTARLWPNIVSLALQENAISELSTPNCKEIFKNLKELDLHRTKIMDFDQVCKLGNIKTLTSLNLMENGIEEIKLPDCDADAKLNIFEGLEQLNIFDNPIWNEADAFNELDKLPKLKKLNKKPHPKSDFNGMFSKAVGMISNLEVVNKIKVTAEDRRFAEYDIWKQYAVDWVQASKTPEALRDFYKKHRNYAKIVRKYGSPADFVPRTTPKQSNLLNLRIQNARTKEMWEKKVPRQITVQTLKGLIIKHFHLELNTMPRLFYMDSKRPEIVVPMENGSKTLDFYSVQDNDVVIVQW